MAKKRQVSASLDEELVKEMEKIRDLTGLPVSIQIELRLKGYTVCKIGEKHSGSDKAEKP